MINDVCIDMSSVMCVLVCGQVRVAAMQCLVKIMSLFYQYMKHYMGPALFAVSPHCSAPFVSDGNICLE